MKTRNILSLLLVLLFSLSAFAQREERKGERQRFDMEKHAKDRADFISKELNLTDAERKAFIPLMEEYIDARFALNREVRNATRKLMGKSNKTDADFQMIIDKNLEVKQKELNLQKKYYKKFGEVLSPEKIHKYDFAEREFVQKVVKRYHKEREPKEDK